MNDSANTSFSRRKRALQPRRGDFLAGISVAAIAIPQALAYAELAGMPAHTGLYAAALPPIVAAVFASSRYLQTGPVAMTSLLVFGALAGIATPGTAEYVQSGILLALIVGVIRVFLGWILRRCAGLSDVAAGADGIHVGGRDSDCGISGRADIRNAAW